MKIGNTLFAFRVGDEEPTDGGCPIGGEFVYKTTKDLFAGKRVIIFGLPGAYTPTCSTYQLPGFDEMFDQFKAEGIDEIWCTSVNDAFVMNNWAEKLGLKNVKMLPDGNGDFARLMGMLVYKTNLGFGARSWRYAAIVDDCVVTKMFEEDGKADNVSGDPYEVSSPGNILKFLTQELS